MYFILLHVAFKLIYTIVTMNVYGNFIITVGFFTLVS